MTEFTRLQTPKTKHEMRFQFLLTTQRPVLFNPAGHQLCKRAIHIRQHIFVAVTTTARELEGQEDPRLDEIKKD